MYIFASISRPVSLFESICACVYVHSYVQVCVQFLLNCEVSPDTANYEGLTPCHLATSRACLEALYERGALPYCVDSHRWVCACVSTCVGVRV